MSGTGALKLAEMPFEHDSCQHEVNMQRTELEI
jgi:hypothetical protein